jgi:hypothetical protein
VRLALVAALLGVFHTQALAQQHTSARNDLQQALLTETLDGDYDAAILEYQRLVRNLADGHPVRAQALYQLGAARYALGDLRGARDALIEGIRSGACRSPCHSLLGEMDMEANAVRKIPFTWDFTNGNHGLFHPWKFDDKGTVRVQSQVETENPALIWSTRVDVQKGDVLVVGFRDPSPTPKSVRFLMQAVPYDAAIRVRVVDDQGRSYGLPDGVLRIGQTQPTVIQIALTDLQPAVPEDPPLQPSSLHRLYIEDVSAFNGTPPGTNHLYIDDFEVR